MKVVETPKRKGDWIKTYTGKQFYPQDPKVEDIDIEDIAHALSLTCRFNGHIKEFYSTAQHAVLCSMVAPSEFKWEALHHDDSEAYISDLTRPVKGMLPQYTLLERGIEDCLALKFSLPKKMSDEVKLVDTRMLVTEASQLMSSAGICWWESSQYPKPYQFTINLWNPSAAEEKFLETYNNLRRNHGPNLV